MAKRRCKDCPRLVDVGVYKGRCPECARVADRARGTTTERGYGAAHQAERARYASRIRSGEVIRCVDCDAPLSLDFHLGHTADRACWKGPQCPTCNLSQAGAESHLNDL